MIRPATSSDLPAMLPVARKFFAETNLRISLKDEVWVKNWTGYLNSGIGVVFISEQDGRITGGIGGLRYLNPNDDEPMLSEMFWYVDPAARGHDGLRLKATFQKWAKENGIHWLTMVHLDELNSRLGRVYERDGFWKLESHYIKEL